MAKSAKKKEAKEASNIFHNIMKASMNVDINKNSKGARQWFPFDHPTTGRRYIIRYYYEDDDKVRKCIISIESNNPKEPGESEVKTISYDPKSQGIDIDERSKMIAIEHGNMQPADPLKKI